MLCILAQLLIVAFVWLKRPKKPPDPLSTAPQAANPRTTPSAAPILPSASEGVLADVEASKDSPTDLDDTPIYYLGKKAKIRPFSITNVRSNVLHNFNRKQISLATGLSFATSQETAQFLLDTGSTHHVCNRKELFVGPTHPVRGVQLTGVGGSIYAKGVGSIQLKIRADDGKFSRLVIHNVLFVPDCPANLISPQKLVGGKGVPTACTTTCGPMTVFSWDKNCTKTIHHSPHLDLPLINADDSNTPISRLDNLLECEKCALPVPASHSRCSKLFVSKDKNGDFYKSVVPFDYGCCDSLDDFPSVNSSTFSQDDDDSSCVSCHSESDSDTKENSIDESESVNDIIKELKSVLEEIKSPQTSDDKEFLRLHYRLNHLPYSKMQRLAEKGIIPQKFEASKYKPPPCPACTIGKQRKRPWRTRKDSTKSLRKAKNLGDRIHVNHMHSAQPGLIGQVTGWLTRRRFVGSLVFIDEVSNYTMSIISRILPMKKPSKERNASKI